VPGNSRSAILAARLLVAGGDPTAAEAELANGCEQFASDVNCLDTLFELALQNRSPHLESITRALLAAACGDNARCSATLTRLGDQYGANGQWNIALNYYERAAREAPTRETWRAIESAAARLGQTQLVSDARRHLRLLDGAEAAHPTPGVTEGERSNLPASGVEHAPAEPPR
jgi:tetratricopeptide (TPR) repeat protein